MNQLDIRSTHSPYFDPANPVYPDAPDIPSLFFLHAPMDWKWEVTVQVFTFQYFFKDPGW